MSILIYLICILALQGLSDIKTDITEIDLQAKLAMLIMAFPNLRIIWSSSALETAIIFEDLKVYGNDIVSILTSLETLY